MHNFAHLKAHFDAIRICVYVCMCVCAIIYLPKNCFKSIKGFLGFNNKIYVHPTRNAVIHFQLTLSLSLSIEPKADFWSGEFT